MCFGGDKCKLGKEGKNSLYFCELCAHNTALRDNDVIVENILVLNFLTDKRQRKRLNQIPVINYRKSDWEVI